MNRSTRNLAVFALTWDTPKERETASTAVAGTIASRLFGDAAKDPTTVDDTMASFMSVLSSRSDLLDKLAASVTKKLSAIDMGDVMQHRQTIMNDPDDGMNTGAVDDLAELVSQGLEENGVTQLVAVLGELDARLRSTRRDLPVTSPQRQQPLRPRAAVFGAGIAGLTAAHELAERGFSVTVYEMAADERAAPGLDLPPVKLGGMAASHLAKKPEPLPADGEEPYQDGAESVVRAFRPVWGEKTPPAHMYPTQLPGEHGFRFFPAYYLHIWDMLQRIPLSEYDSVSKAWTPTHRTVFDNIQRVVTQATTTPSGHPSLIFPREAPRGLAEFLGGLDQLREVGFTPSDVSTFTSRLTRYLATSPRRRAREFEDISAYEYFVGADSGHDQPMYDYSRAFDEQLRNMPKVLAAFDGFYGDARTNLSTYLQLQLRMDRRDNKADGVLRGPTTESWFDHWFRDLSGRLGVKFSRWQLKEFQFVTGSGSSPDIVKAKGTWLGDGEPEGATIEADYYVVALDAPQAEIVVESLADSGHVGGTVAELEGWTSDAPPGEPPMPQNSNERTPRDPAAPQGVPRDKRKSTPDGAIGPYNMSQLGLQPWDRYQTLSGLQFYFDTEFQLVHGHVYYTDSPWALSSINHHGLWEASHLPTIPKHKFVSVLSVDIGDWNTPAPANPHKPDSAAGRPAQACSPDQIAEEVWRQIKISLGNDMPRAAQTFPTPVWYTLDRSFKVGDNGDGQTRIIENRAPYLVPIMSDWQNRPGGDPWNPHHTSLSYRPTDEREATNAQERVWTAEHGGYEVHCGRLVFAGTWTRTFTRMTSMEAACESGRHAVNAILDHVIHTQTGDPRDDDVGLRWMWPYNFLDQSGSGPIRQPTPVGDYCYIFDVENREPAEFRPIRDLDNQFVLWGRAHPFELGGIDALIRSGAAGATGPMLDPAMPLNPYSKGFFDWVVGHLQNYRSFLELLDRQTRSSSNDAGLLARMNMGAEGTSSPPSTGDPFDIGPLNRFAYEDGQIRVDPVRGGSQRDNLTDIRWRLRNEGPFRNLLGRDFR